MDTRHPRRYRILSPIGEGGMGSVDLAEDLELGRRVALKFLPARHAADAAARRRLLREATAAAGLDHPFVCKVYEVGEIDGRPFIAMEYVEGRTLKGRLADGPLPIAEALRVAAEVAEALDCAQRHGVVHRDVKPSNVALAADGHVKVMDFGIAERLVPADGEASAALTATLGPSGTLPYMSPEQLRGEQVDSRSDIFSFGLVLYEMITGRRPFGRESAIATAAATLEEPTPSLEPHVHGAPPLLGHLIERLLAKDAGDRFQTFRDVRSELTSLMGAGSTSAAPARRRSMTMAAGTALVVVVAAFFAFQRAAKPALAFGERDWILIATVENLTGDPVFDRSLATALDVAVAQSQYVNVFPRSRVRDALARMQRPMGTPIDEAVASEIAVREGVKGVLACSVAQVGTIYQLTVRLIDPASHAVVWSESVRANEKDDVLPALDDLATGVRRSLGESLGRLSRHHLPLPQATTASLDALELYADAVTSDDRTSVRLLEEAVALDPDFALAHAALGLSYYRASERAQRLRGEAHVARALSLLDRLSLKERLLVTALAQDSRGNREEAIPAYRAYLAAYPDDSEVWFRLGWTYMAGLGQFAEGAEAFRRVIEIYPGAFGAIIDLATCYKGMGRFQEARDLYEKAFAQRPGEMVGDFVNHEYGFTLVQLGELDRAAEVFEKMESESDPSRRGKGYRSSALLDAYRGRYAAAQRSFDQAIVADRAADADVSEFRDRLFRAATLWAEGEGRALDDEIRRIQALVRGMALGPEWVRAAVKLFARSERIAQARQVLEVAGGNADDPTSDSSTNRNRQDDAAYLDVARGELALASGRADEAVTLLTGAHEQLGGTVALESVAAAFLAAGHLEEAAERYQEFIDARPLGSEAQEYWFRAHLRLAGIRERQNDVDAARVLYQEILTVWQDADADLPLLREARARLEALG